MKIEDYLIELKQNGVYPNSILDIGSNVGDFSNFCKRLWPNSKILMVEGNENCEEDLIRTGIDYKILLLGDENRKVTFHMNRRNLKCTGSSYYKEVTQHYMDSIQVEKELVKLDDITNETYDIIKIDTQGSELDILKGGVETVNKAKYIIIELSLKEYNENSPLLSDVINYMDSIGFSERKEIEKHVWMSNDNVKLEYGEIFQIDMVFQKCEI